ncbi:MAG: valyl-tRNA synthetase [Myxococcota bacterium]
MAELPKAYDPAASEADLYADWVAAGIFHAEHDDPGEPFSIVIPPPNVTGSLHVGHALDNTIQDAIIRRERMRGKNAVWVPGLDHAGIATQTVVEKQLAAEGLTRHDLGREAFIERVWQWKAESGGTILEQLRQLGASCDWEREAFTFDEQRNKAVEKVFIQLHEQGLIYRGNRLINWDPVANTAISDIEVEHDEITGELASFRYEFADGEPGPAGIEAGIVCATTRMETMLGDTAIAVHPEDERYTSVIGRHVKHPFQDRTFAIIADEYVDPEFGSGAVKITPAHDPNDYEIGLRHELPMLTMLNLDGTVNDEFGGEFAGLDRFVARTAIKARLDELGLLVGVKPHVHQVGHSSRSKAVIEPMLSDQWFVDVHSMAQKAIESVRSGRVTFIPSRLGDQFVIWLENLHDWCISRQLWWGHRIPAWHHATEGIKVQSDSPGDGWEQDPDVLDTWFSSQLWPFVLFGWPDDTPEMRTWFPTSTLVTGYDINTFWVARMVMISEQILGTEPFKIVHNHGLVRDEHGKKMSKSFGNVIDPLDLIAEFGADATRFALLRSAAPGVDVPLARDWVEGEKKFANKLWNAVRFALSNLDGVAPGELPPVERRTLDDRWVLSRLEAARAEADAAYEVYDWPTVCRSLRSFAWNELADWYLESVKVRMYGDDAQAATDAKAVLAVVLDQLLRLLHPTMPFVTETLWRGLTGAAGGTESLAVASWPTAIAERDAEAEEAFGLIQDLVTEVRRFRSQNGVADRVRFALDVATDASELLAPHVDVLCTLAGLDAVTFVAEASDDPGLARVLFTRGTATTPLAGLIDVGEEIGRLRKELGKAEGMIKGIQGKLANDSFVANAPEQVVVAERARLAVTEGRIADLSSQISTLEAL